jgi:hypothetical protein
VGGVQGDGGGADGFARQPADTLEGEGRVHWVGIGFVLVGTKGVSILCMAVSGIRVK